MNKHEISKIVSFINEVKQLPDEVVSPAIYRAFTSNNSTEHDRKLAYAEEKKLFKTVHEIQIRLLAYFRALPGDNSTYIDLIGEITFKPKHFVYDTIHFENNKAWLADKNALFNLLTMAKVEFEEKARMAKQSPENSFFSYFKTKEAKGIILSALLALITGIATKDLWWYKLFPDPHEIKPIISKTIDSVSADKKLVISKTVKEVFTNYYHTIESLRAMYVPVSAEGHIQDYLAMETTNINSMILNKSYVHRFSTNERFWTDNDFREVAKLIKSRTIDHIMEISKEVESEAQGGFMLTDDRLRLLEEKVRIECSCN
ncbi:hypothetical protein [Mucilaginibacter sp.]|jgi:hypothetical protein|uniref:hypothetical protein n=1 Tax=Mucilaginibacter sp. TaxID=1882438 RepID=UPI002CE76C41|nr:hypothetical protein [Mucilaginibacter sp.]HTI60904.1 hypothetical protein [Mucilaginibacter sp.]